MERLGETKSRKALTMTSAMTKTTTKTTVMTTTAKKVNVLKEIMVAGKHRKPPLPGKFCVRLGRLGGRAVVMN